MSRRATAAKITAAKITAPKITAANTLRDWPLLAALAICLVAAALRIPPLRDSLWLDELHTAWCAIGPLDEVAERATMGNQSPVFYWLEWLLIEILGASESTLRLPSFIAGTLLPLSIFLLARRWNAATAGLVAACLIAVDPLSIFYATEARPYATVQIMAVLFIAVTAQLAEHATIRRRAEWICLAALLFYLHYTAALLVAAAAVFLAIAPLLARQSFTYSLASLVIDLPLTAALCSLAFLNVREIFARRANWAAFVKSLPIWDAIDWTPLPLWAWLLLIIAAFVSWRLTSEKSTERPLLPLGPLVLLWLFIPLTIAWLSTATDVARLFFPRYLASAFPAAALLAGLCVQQFPGRWLQALAAAATIGIAFWSGGIIDQIRQDGRVIADRNENWRSAVAWLNERLPTGGYPVLVYSGLIEANELSQPHDPLLDDYCLCPVKSLYSLDAAPSDLFPLTLHNPLPLPTTAEQLAMHRGGCWLVVRGNKQLAESIALPLWSTLQPTTTKQGNYRTTSFGKVQVVSIRLE